MISADTALRIYDTVSLPTRLILKFTPRPVQRKVDAVNATCRLYIYHKAGGDLPEDVERYVKNGFEEPSEAGDEL